MDFRFRPGLLGNPTLAFGNIQYSQTNVGFCASGNANLSSCGPGMFGGGRGTFGSGSFQPLTPNNMMMHSRQPGPINMAGGPIHQNVSMGQNQWTGGAQYNMGVARMMNDSQCSTMNWSQNNFNCSQISNMNNQFPMSQNALKPMMLHNPNLNRYGNQHRSHRLMMIQQQNFSRNYMQDVSEMTMCQQQWFNRSNGMSSDDHVPDHKPLALRNSRFDKWCAGHNSSNMMNNKRSNADFPTFLKRNIHPLNHGDKSGYQRRQKSVHCSREEVQVEKVVTRRTVTGTLRRSHMKKDDEACGEETVTVQTRKTVFRQTPVQEVFEYNHNSSVQSSGVKSVSLCRDTRDSDSSGDRKSQITQDGAHRDNEFKDECLDQTRRNHNGMFDAKPLVTEYHHKRCQSKNDSLTKTPDNADLNVDRLPENDLRSEGNLSDSADDLIPGENSVLKRKDKSFVRGLEDRHRRSRLDRWIESTLKDKPVEKVTQSCPDSLERIPPHPVNKFLSPLPIHREKRSQTEGKGAENRLQLDLKTEKGKQASDVIKQNKQIFSFNDKYSLLRSKRSSTSPSCHVLLNEGSQQSKRRSSRGSAAEDHPCHRRTEKACHRNRTEKSHLSDVKIRKKRHFKSSDAVPSVRRVGVIRTLTQANPINESTARSYSFKEKGKCHSSHEEGKTVKHRAENKISEDHMYAEEKFRGCNPPLRFRKEIGNSYQVTKKTRCSNAIVKEQSRSCCEETEKRLYRDNNENGSSSGNRNERRHSDPIITSMEQQKNEHVDFSPLYGTETGHASPSKGTVVLEKCPQKSGKIIKTTDKKAYEKQIETMSSTEVSMELKKNNLKQKKCQGFALDSMSNNDRPGFSFVKPKQNGKHNFKSPPRFWSSEYLNYVSFKNTHRDSTDHDSETSLAKMKASCCFIPRSVSLGRVAQKLASSLQDAKRKRTKTAVHIKDRQPVNQDPLFTPDPFTVVTRKKISLNKQTDESLKEVSSTGLSAHPSLPQKSEHSSVVSNSLPSNLLEKTCQDSQAEVPKPKDSYKSVGSGLKITLIRGAKPAPKSSSENIKGSKPKSIPVSRRSNPRTCVSARKHVVTPLLAGEKRHAKKSRSLECSPADVMKEGKDLVRNRRRTTRRCLGDRFSLLLKSPLSHTESFMTPKSREQAECNRKSSQKLFESLPTDTKNPLSNSKASVNHMKSPPHEMNPPPDNFMTPVCHTESALRLLEAPLEHVKTLPVKDKTGPAYQMNQIKVTASQIKHDSSQPKLPSLDARSPLSLIKSSITKSKTFVTQSTRSLERKICDRKRKLESHLLPAVDVTPFKMSTSRLRDDEMKPISKHSTLCSHTKCPTPLRLSVTKKGPAKCADHELNPTPTRKVVTPASPQSSEVSHTLSFTKSASVTPPMNLGQEWGKKILTPLGSTLSPTSSSSVSPRVSSSLNCGQGVSQMVSTHFLTHSDSVTPTMISESLTPLRLFPKSPNDKTAECVTSPRVSKQTGCVHKGRVLVVSRPHYYVETHNQRLEVDTDSTDEPGKASVSQDTNTTAQRSGNKESSHGTYGEDITENSSKEGNGEDECTDNSESILEHAVSASSILSAIPADSGIKLKFTTIKKDNFQEPCCSSSHGDNSTVIPCLGDMNCMATRKCVQQGNHCDCQKVLEKSSKEQFRGEGGLDVSHKVVLRKRLSVDIPSSDTHCSFKKAKLSGSDSVTVKGLTDSEDPLAQDQKISCQDMNPDVQISGDGLLRGGIEDLGQVVEVGDLDSSDVTMTDVTAVSSDTMIDEGSWSARKDSEGSSGKHHRGYKKRFVDGKKDYDLRNKKTQNEKKRSSVGLCDGSVNHRLARRNRNNSESENIISKNKCSCKVGRRNGRGRHSNECEVSKKNIHSSEDTGSRHHKECSGRSVDRHSREHKNGTSKSSSGCNALKQRSDVIKSHGKTKCRRDSQVAVEKKNKHRITFNIIQGHHLTQPRLRLRKCVYCNSFCTRLTHIMREHVTVVHPHKCLTCHVAFKNKLEARAHKLTRHLKEVHHCMLCHKVLMSRVRYERHIQCKSHMRLMEAQREALSAICKAFFQGGQEDFSETLRKVQSQETGLWNPDKGCGKKALPPPGNEPAPPQQPAPNLSHLRHFYYDNPELGQMVKKFEEFSPAQNVVLGSTVPSTTVPYTDPQSDVFFFPLPPVQDSESWTFTTETESETEVSTQITVQDRDLLDLSLSEALGTAISEWQDPLPSGLVSEHPNIPGVYAAEEQLMSGNRANMEAISLDTNDQASSFVGYGHSDPHHSGTYLCQTDTKPVTDLATESSVSSDLDDAHKMLHLVSLPNRIQGSDQSAGCVTLTSTSTKMPSCVDINTNFSSSLNNCPVPVQETETFLTTDVKVVCGTICPVDTSMTMATHPVGTNGDIDRCLAYENSVAKVDTQLVSADMNSCTNTESNEKSVSRLENRDNHLCFNLTNMTDLQTCPPAPLMLPSITSTSDRSNTCMAEKPHDVLTHNDNPQQAGTSPASDTDHPCSLFSPPVECPVMELSTPSCTSDVSQPLPLKLSASPSGNLPSHQCNVRLLCDYTDSSEDESSACDDACVSQVSAGQDMKNADNSSKSQDSVDAEVTENQVHLYWNGKPSTDSVGDGDESETLVRSKQGRDSNGAETTENPVHLYWNGKPGIDSVGGGDESESLVRSKQGRDSMGAEATENAVHLYWNGKPSTDSLSDGDESETLVRSKQGRDSNGAEATENPVQLYRDVKHLSPVIDSIGNDKSGCLVWSKQTTHLSSLHSSADAEVTKDLVQSRLVSKNNCSIEFSDDEEVDDLEECRLKAEFCLLLKEIAEDEEFLCSA